MPEIASPIMRAEEEDKFDGLVDRTLWEERPASKIRPTQSCSATRPDDFVREEIAGIHALFDSIVVRLSGDAWRSTELNLHTNAVSVIRAVFNRFVAKAFHSSVSRTAVKWAVQ